MLGLIFYTDSSYTTRLSLSNVPFTATSDLAGKYTGSPGSPISPFSPFCPPGPGGPSWNTKSGLMSGDSCCGTDNAQRIYAHETSKTYIFRNKGTSLWSFVQKTPDLEIFSGNGMAIVETCFDLARRSWALTA